jgi:hypothetical protein
VRTLVCSRVLPGATGRGDEDASPHELNADRALARMLDDLV